MAVLKVHAFELERGRVAVLLAVPAGEPPTEFRIFAKGVTPTTKGPVLFDDKAGAAVLDAFREQGLDLLPFDVGHGMLSPLSPPDGHKAFGWFKPAVLDGELWATSIEWTERGADALKKREFRYFSPAIQRELESGRVRELINIALTNIPATIGQKPLVASKTGAKPGGERTHMDLEEFLRMLGVRTAAEALSRFTEFSMLETSLLSLTGEPTRAAAVSKVTNWKAEAATATTLARRVTELEASTANVERDATIARLSSEGRLQPSLHEWAKTQTKASLELFAAGAQVVTPGASGGGAGSGGGKGTTELAEQTVTLSAVDLEVCKQVGMSPTDFLEQRKLELAQQRAAQGGG